MARLSLNLRLLASKLRKHGPLKAQTRVFEHRNCVNMARLRTKPASLSIEIA